MARSKAFYQVVMRRKVTAKPAPIVQPSAVESVADEPQPKKSRSSKRRAAK